MNIWISTHPYDHKDGHKDVQKHVQMTIINAN